MTIEDLRQNPVVMWVGGGLSTLVLAFVIWSFLPSPQIGTDEEVFKTVDALFTAITTRDPKRLDDCQQRLRAFREGGKLPVAAAKSLDSIVQQANTGKWDKSAHRLYDFMLAQRRAN
jgi:hypothetical protein